MAETTWERKKTKRNREQQSNHAMVRIPLTYTQPMHGWWALSQEIYRWCGLVEGENSLFQVSSQDLFQEMLCWDGNFVQIQVVSGWDYLMHAREVGSERSMALSIQGRGKGSQQNQMNHNLLWNGQWRGEKVLGMPRVSGGRITKQKWLVSHRGKREKSYRDSLV